MQFPPALLTCKASANTRDRTREYYDLRCHHWACGGLYLDKAANLRTFFAESANSVTRERIFFNRLSFDLKIAAARAGYHLHLYEPDVDRDGFDIVAEDEDRVGWYQTKAVLSGAGTATWEVSAGFLRPALNCADAYGFAPVEAGRGGGVILIEISDQTTDGQVSYRYTDFDILVAIAEGFLIERPYMGRGRPAKPAREEAGEVMALLREEDRGAKVALPKKAFVTVATPDNLLGVMGLRSEAAYGMYAIRNAYGRVTISADGSSGPDAPLSEVSTLHYNMGLLCNAQPVAKKGRKDTLFDQFEWIHPAQPGA